MKFEDEGANVQQGDAGVDRNQGAARAISVSETNPLNSVILTSCSLSLTLH